MMATPSPLPQLIFVAQWGIPYEQLMEKEEAQAWFMVGLGHDVGIR